MAMSMWLIILAATAFGGAMTLWHAVSKAKHFSEGMLDEYAHMLAEARQRKARELSTPDTTQEADAAEPTTPAQSGTRNTRAEP
jgi:Flp pilus assembly protein TadB